MANELEKSKESLYNTLKEYLFIGKADKLYLKIKRIIDKFPALKINDSSSIIFLEENKPSNCIKKDKTNNVSEFELGMIYLGVERMFKNGIKVLKLNKENGFSQESLTLDDILYRINEGARESTETAYSSIGDTLDWKNRPRGYITGRSRIGGRKPTLDMYDGNFG